MKTKNFCLFYMFLFVVMTTQNAYATQFASNSPMSDAMFDTDRNMILKDSDGDGIPDLTETLEGTNPNDKSDFQGVHGELEAANSTNVEAVGFPTTACRPGYRQVGSRLCISTNVQNATRYPWAQRRCRVQRGRMASYEDLYYLYIHSNLDASYNPNGRWIGNMVADDNALCGNRSITFNGDPDRDNFEGTCNKNNVRGYWCAHDLASSTGTPPGQPQVTYRLQVRRFQNTGLTNADADRIFGDASRVIQTDDGPNDIACNVRMLRDGTVTAFTTGDGSIDSGAEFSAVNGLPGNIKVVNQINWCSTIGANIIGCAPVPGNSLVVVRFTTNLEGILWLHEFGHNKGRSHRNGTSNVMHPSIGADRLGVNTDECNAFRTSPLVALAGDPSVLAADTSLQFDTSAAEAPEDVRDFVRQHFFHGTPYEQATTYGTEAIPVLLEMLKDPKEMEWWPNIVATLGMIGDESVVDPLIEFLENNGNGPLERSHYSAKSVVPLALGYAVNRSGSSKALDYLIAATDPQFWSSKKVGRSEFQASMAQRNDDLTTKVTLGLALTGNSKARETLQNMKVSGSQSTREFQALHSDLIDEAVRENETIEKQGLKQYYSKH